MHLMFEFGPPGIDLLDKNTDVPTHTINGVDTGIIAVDPANREWLAILEKVIPAGDVMVLIEGDTGVGKELVARAISQCVSEPRTFHPKNMGALPPGLLESELFGHEKGSFTSAHKAREGLFRRAGNGVVFLDEVGELTPEAQVRLLRVLQEHRVQKVGQHGRTDPIHCRIVCATNCDLEGAVAAGKFREDLYHRLKVVTIRVPSLNERPADILPLIMMFARKYASRIRHLNPPKYISSEAVECLVNHDWRGNIRELENLVERLMSTLHGDVACIDVEHLPEEIRLPREVTAVVRETARQVTITLPAGRELPDLETLQALVADRVTSIHNRLTTRREVPGGDPNGWLMKSITESMGLDPASENLDPELLRRQEPAQTMELTQDETLEQQV
jgi:DNA-binding NtrC family response regulator